MVQAYTEAYHLDGAANPDTVLRLYDSSGNILAEDDDFPYWVWGTDSALFWQATDADGYYLEVLDWSDWSPDSQGPEGGAAYDYELHLQQHDLDDLEWGDNDTMEEADYGYYAARADGSDGYELYWWLFPLRYGDTALDQFFGEIEQAGDIDLWPIELGEDSVGSFYQCSFWYSDLQSLAPLMTLYDEDWNLLAQTTDPVIANGGKFYYDPGITYRIPKAGRYYLAVEDELGGGGGSGYFYPGVQQTWDFSFVSSDQEPNHPIQRAQSLAMSESGKGSGYWYGWFSGLLDTSEDQDFFLLRSSAVGGLSGQFLSVFVETALHGSQLNAELTLYRADGGGSYSELASALLLPGGSSSDDPAITNLELTSDDDVYIAITHEDPGDRPAPSHSFFGFVDLYSSAVY